MQDAHAASTSTRSAWWSCAVLVALCLAVGLQTVRSDNYFLGDDFGLVHHLHDLHADRFLTYFVSDWTEGAYGVELDELRPLLAFSYWLDAHLFGSVNATGYHVTNLVLHLLNALLVLGIARSIAPGEPMAAALAASFFVLMPSHAEPIAWISGRVDSLASLFYLGSFLCFVRFRQEHRGRWLFGAIVVFAGGLFAKQSAVTLPVLLIAFDWLWPPSQPAARGSMSARVWPHVPFVLLTAFYLALRHSLFDNAVREDLLTAETIKAFILRQDSYARELMPTPNEAPKPFKLLAEVLTVGTLVICLGWVLARRHVYRDAIRRLVFFGVVWYAITIAPMVVTYFSARHLYITTAGLSIAMATLILPASPVEPRRKRIRGAMAATLIALYAISSSWNVSVWVATGIESQRFASGVVRLLRSVPRGSVVLVGVPEWHLAGWFWSWASPFALQPPFTHEDLTAAFRVVERPATYCCPPDQWWAARRAAVTSLLDSPAQEVTVIEFAPGTGGAPAFSTRRVDGHELRRRLENALGTPLESLTTKMTPAQANEVSRILFEPQ